MGTFKHVMFVVLEEVFVFDRKKVKVRVRREF